MNTLFILPLGMIGTWEFVAIVAVLVLLFGGKKIPELMRGIGKGVKEFKHGMEEVEKSINAEEKTSEKVLEPDKIEKTK